MVKFTDNYGNVTFEKSEKSTPRPVMRRMKLLGYIKKAKSNIRSCSQNRRQRHLVRKYQAKLDMFELLLADHYKAFPQSRPIGYEQPRPGIGRAGNGHPASPQDHRSIRNNQQDSSASVAQVGSRPVNARDSRHKGTATTPADMSGAAHSDHHSRSTVQWDCQRPEESNPARQAI